MDFSSMLTDTLAGRALRLPLKLLPRDTVMPILQGPCRGMRWIVGSGTHGYWLGSFEESKRRVFERVVARDSVVYDVGAHAGYYSLLASRLVGPAGRVYAFEPLPANVGYLNQHLRLNRIENVTVIQAAVLDRDGRASFAEGPNSLMGRVSPEGSLQVAAVGLDALVESRSALPPNYVKIDVEGAELLVLQGGRRLLVREHPTIFLATHGPEVRTACQELLACLGYSLLCLGGQRSGEPDEFLASYARAPLGL